MDKKVPRFLMAHAVVRYLCHDDW